MELWTRVLVFFVLFECGFASADFCNSTIPSEEASQTLGNLLFEKCTADPTCQLTKGVDDAVALNTYLQQTADQTSPTQVFLALQSIVCHPELSPTEAFGLFVLKTNLATKPICPLNHVFVPFSQDLVGQGEQLSLLTPGYCICEENSPCTDTTSNDSLITLSLFLLVGLSVIQGSFLIFAGYRILRQIDKKDK